jgi:hypothetical protein
MEESGWQRFVIGYLGFVIGNNVADDLFRSGSLPFACRRGNRLVSFSLVCCCLSLEVHSWASEA